jgi:iron complex outermembrane receptor protein
MAMMLPFRASSQTRAPRSRTSQRQIWQPEDDRFEAQLFVENIGDELYSYSRVASATGAYVSGQFSPPRTYGLRLSMKLGSAAR